MKSKNNNYFFYKTKKYPKFNVNSLNKHNILFKIKNKEKNKKSLKLLILLILKESITFSITKN